MTKKCCLEFDNIVYEKLCFWQIVDLYILLELPLFFGLTEAVGTKRSMYIAVAY